MRMRHIRGLITPIVIAIFGAAFVCAQNSAPDQTRNIVVEEKVEQKVKPQIEAKGNGKQEGIKVHGHWIIEVKDPAGKVITHREFENSLVTTGGGQNGPAALTDFLLGYAVPYGYYIIMSTTADVESGVAVAYSPSWASLECNGNNTEPYAIACTLVAAPIANGFSLSAAVPDAPAGTIGYVTTRVSMCSNGNPPTGPTTISPASCLMNELPSNVTAFNYDFTEANVPTPIPVSAGQTVQVTVQITFQ
jgi:hypothetical protein